MWYTTSCSVDGTTTTLIDIGSLVDGCLSWWSTYIKGMTCVSTRYRGTLQSDLPPSSVTKRGFPENVVTLLRNVYLITDGT